MTRPWHAMKLLKDFTLRRQRNHYAMTPSKNCI